MSEPRATQRRSTESLQFSARHNDTGLLSSCHLGVWISHWIHCEPTWQRGCKVGLGAWFQSLNAESLCEDHRLIQKGPSHARQTASRYSNTCFNSRPLMNIRLTGTKSQISVDGSNAVRTGLPGASQYVFRKPILRGILSTCPSNAGHVFDRVV